MRRARKRPGQGPNSAVEASHCTGDAPRWVAYTPARSWGFGEQVLNRIFVLIGVLVILAIGAAFIVPRFIQWGEYRERLQTMASTAFGTEVAIEGDIHLTLLPQPKLEITKVRVGPPSAPVLEVGQITAEVSLLDFLRDQYKVTGLTLDHPVINVAVGADGALATGLKLADASQSNVSIANANVTGGQVRLIDGKSGVTYVADGVSGQLKLDALQGPFSFSGSASVDHTAYDMRVSTTKFDDAGGTNLSLYVKAQNSSFTFESTGPLQPSPVKYTGTFSYRQPPPKPKEGEAADLGRGDLTLTGKLDASADRVLLSDYTALPDENRAATRLTGAAEFKLGKEVSFNAILSGGVVALPPRDATKELTDPPYELVRLLGETPLPPIPGIKGTIGLDITELDLRTVSLRDLRLDASTDTHSWTITDFAATLPGATKVGLNGNLSIVDGKPIFAGGVTLDSQQLDRLASLWRKLPPDSPLFGKTGSLTSDVALSSDTLTLSSGTLVVGGINQAFGAEIGFGPQRHLKLDAHFTTLGPEESSTIAALLPDVSANGSFGATFPKGEINLSASKAVLFGLDGTELIADATWEGGVLEFSKLAAADLGGAAFDGKLTAFGTLLKPELSGNGTLKIADKAPVVDAALNALKTPPAVADFLRQSLPATLTLQLDAPSGDGGQVLNVSGRLSTADAKLEAKLSTGIANALTAPLAAKLNLSSDSPLLMTRQLGLGATPIFGDGKTLNLAVSVDGVPSNSYETHVALTGGDDHIQFDGNVVPGDFTKIGGTGALDVKLSDPAILAEALGAGGIYLPPIAGKADLDFSGDDSAKLSRIQASGVSGELALTRAADNVSISGGLKVASLDLKALVPAVAGAASTVASEDSVWPQGPIDIGSAARTTTGRIDVTADTITAGDAPFMTGAAFGYDWDAQSLHLRNLSGKIGSGGFSADVTVCCSAANQTDKQINGRVTLSGVALDAIAPKAISAGLTGTLDTSAEFSGSGETLGQAIETLSGTGSYTINGFSAAHFDPGVFTSLDGLTDVVDTPPETLTQAVTDKLSAGPFAAPSLTGTFTIAGGTVRSPNLAIAGTGARIFGGANLALKDLTLDARYAMSPTTTISDKSVIDATTAEVDALIKGPLWAPQASYDVASLIEGMKIKASEIELALLEQRKAEADARIKAAADLQAKLDVLKPGQSNAVGGAAMKLAQDAAAKKAAAALAAQKAAASNDLGM